MFLLVDIFGFPKMDDSLKLLVIILGYGHGPCHG